jgi:protein phosphatase
MSPAETSSQDGWLERPEEVFAYYGDKGMRSLVFQEKHLGWRAPVLIARTQEADAKHFGVHDGARGVIVTRTGRRFFNDAEIEAEGAFTHRCGDAGVGAVARSPDRLGTVGLRDHALEHEGRRAGARAIRGCGSRGDEWIGGAVGCACSRSKQGVDVGDLATRTSQRLAAAEDYRVAYNRYVAPFAGIGDLRIAPFHLLATEAAVHDDKDHVWHMEMAHRLAGADTDMLLETRYRRVDLDDVEQVRQAVAWWEEHTGAGGEGIVVKPLPFVARGKRGLL